MKAAARFAAALLFTPLALAGATIEAAFSPGDAEARVVAVIGEAKREVRMAAFSFTSRTVANALVRAKQRGVTVRAVLDAENDKPSAANSCMFVLLGNGIPVRINDKYSIMHNKFLVIDGATVETGSYNFTISAARHNAENVLIVRDDPRLAATYAAEWQRLWDESAAPTGKPKTPAPQPARPAAK